MARPRPSRLSAGRILRELRLAARKGDRAALTLAVEEMRTLALSPRYWEKYLTLLGNPLARLVDLLVIKQGERIAHQKGRRILGRRAPSPSKPARSREARPPSSPRGGRSKGRPRPTRRAAAGAAEQPMLFELPARP